MDNIFTVENTVSFTPPCSIYYKGTDIMEYCWNRQKYCDEVDVNEILADDKNILIPENMTIGRFIEIINSLRRNIYDIPFTSSTHEGLDDIFGDKSCNGTSMEDIFGEESTSENYSNMSMEDIFGEENVSENSDNMTMNDIFGEENASENSDNMSMDDIFGEEDYVDCEEFTDDEGITVDNCCCKSVEEYEAFHLHISLADLNHLFGTLNPSSDAPESNDDIFEEDSSQCIFENNDEYDEVMDELLNDYMS